MTHAQIFLLSGYGRTVARIRSYELSGSECSLSHQICRVPLNYILRIAALTYNTRYRGRPRCARIYTCQIYVHNNATLHTGIGYTLISICVYLPHS